MGLRDRETVLKSCGLEAPKSLAKTHIVKKHLLIVLLFLAGSAMSQQVEPVRYEVDRWGKDQGCGFQSWDAQGGIMVSETGKTSHDKRRLWRFACIDTSLFEQRSDLIPLPDKLKFAASGCDDRFSAFLFVNDGNRKASDSLDFMVVSFDKQEGKYQTFWDKWPEQSVPLSVEVVDGTMMMAVNNKSGNGFVYFYELSEQTFRTVKPSLSESFVLFQTAAFKQRHGFVVAAKEYEDKRFVSTAFLVFSASGNLMGTYRYGNITNAALGRMVFRFDDDGHLVVIGTLERESGRKVNLEGVTENFDKESVGVVWIRFVGGQPESKTYLFKDMPQIEHALTASDRVRVREERLKKKEKAEAALSEVAFQFLTPRLADFGDLTVFAAEAFLPYYHTETRMSYGYYGYYGGYPYTYTVFDGYDFFSEILLAFDRDGQLQWQQSVKFDNALTYDLFPHAAEGVCHDELVVASPCRNTLRYTAFDARGQALMQLQEEKLPAIHGGDYVDEEYFAEMRRWYGNRFLIYGSQVIQNSTQPKPRRWVNYIQRVQYE